MYWFGQNQENNSGFAVNFKTKEKESNGNLEDNWENKLICVFNKK